MSYLSIVLEKSLGAAFLARPVHHQYRKAVVTITIRLRFFRDSAAIRPLYDHSTSYLTSHHPSVALRPK